MGSSLSHDRLVAILEAQIEIASADLAAREVISLVVARARELTGADAGVVELPEGEELGDCRGGRGDGAEDELTGLPSRRGFEVRLGAEVARVRRHGGELAVCLLGVDDFQEVNQTLGRVVGDEVMRGVAANLSRVRGEDELFRLGADKFALIFPGVGASAAEAAAERLAAAVTADRGCGGVSVSWGVAGPGAGDPAVLVAQAEQALRRAKRARSV